MNAVVVNDLSLNIELDSKALTEIVGGGDYVISTPWKYLSTSYTFKGWAKKSGQWYKRYLRIRKYKRTQCKYQTSYVYV